VRELPRITRAGRLINSPSEKSDESLGCFLPPSGLGADTIPPKRTRNSKGFYTKHPLTQMNYVFAWLRSKSQINCSRTGAEYLGHGVTARKNWLVVEPAEASVMTTGAV